MILVIYDGLWGLTRGLCTYVVSDQVNSVMDTKGSVCGVMEKDRDWLGSSTGRHTKESMDRKICTIEQKGFDLTPCCEHSKKGAPSKL
jgi:hypothetical protein